MPGAFMYARRARYHPDKALKKRKRQVVVRAGTRRRVTKVPNFYRQLGIADRVWVKMKYIDSDTPSLLLTGVTAFVFNTYVGNSLVQPNGGIGISSTAMPYLNEYKAFYNRFKVHSAKVTYECVNTDPTSAVYMFLHVQDDAAPSTFSTWQAIRKFEGNRYTGFRLLSNTSGQNRGRLKQFVRYRNFNGNKKLFDGDSGYSGFTGAVTTIANPGRLFDVYAGLCNVTSTPILTVAIPIKITITYYAELFDRVDLVS